eukprot:m.134349 g.134349  ORF g.134349 m.134349 type:complete len:103 (+) comp9559_c0_seq1:425-733(+)
MIVSDLEHNIFELLAHLQCLEGLHAFITDFDSRCHFVGVFFKKWERNNYLEGENKKKWLCAWRVSEGGGVIKNKLPAQHHQRNTVDRPHNKEHKRTSTKNML